MEKNEQSKSKKYVRGHDRNGEFLEQETNQKRSRQLKEIRDGAMRKMMRQRTER